jgi:putative transposase
MPRSPRAVEGGEIYHVLNRGNGRMRIFHKPQDFDAFLNLLLLAPKRTAPVDILALCLMPNHWHLVVRPRGKSDLAAFMRWLSTAHVRRHHAHYRSAAGHLYQGRYKSFPIQEDLHLLTVLRYVEANPLRAGLAERAGEWAWSSDTLRATRMGRELLCDWPVDRPRNWTKLLEAKLPDQELDRVRTSVTRGQPFGSQEWVRNAADRLGLAFTLRSRGRPKK